MKKVFLVVAFVFATSSLVNAEVNKKSEVDTVVISCIEDAWAFGSDWGSDEMDYKMTDLYYKYFC